LDKDELLLALLSFSPNNLIVYFVAAASVLVEILNKEFFTLCVTEGQIK